MSDEFDIYGDADTGDVADAQWDGGPTAAAAFPNPEGDDLPGFPVDGHPQWRAGIFGSGRGLLGMARVSDLVARPRANAPATLQFGTDQANDGRDPRLQTVSDPVIDQELSSWRGNDPAFAYDIDRKKRQLAESQALSLGSFGGSVAQQALADMAKVAPSAEALGFASPLAWAGIGLGGYMGFVEAPRIQGEIDAMQTRLDELRNRPKT